MASPTGFGKTRKEMNDPPPINPQQPVLSVAPLNSMPYIGPPLPHSYDASSPTRDTETVERVGPAMIFLSSFTTKKDWENIMATTKAGVALTGSAAVGRVGPIIGLMDIGECEDTYLFRVSLPGVSRDEKEFSCDVEPDGKVLIKGVTTTGEKIVCKNSQVFHMLTRNLCPPGHFSISFQLPGPVDHQQFSGSFGSDGVLEGDSTCKEGMDSKECRSLEISRVELASIGEAVGRMKKQKFLEARLLKLNASGW